MAAPTYATNLKDITLAESTTNWSAIGGPGVGVGADFAMQGALCVDKQVSASERGLIFNYGSTIATGEGVYFFTWLFLATPGLAASLANRGASIALGTSTTAYTQFHVEGNDTYGAAGRVGRCYPVQYKITANTGSIPYRTLVGAPGANPQYFGGIVNTTGTVKGSNLGVDAIRYGNGIYITGGDVSTPANFSGMATTNDSITNRWGVFTQVGGTYELQGKIVVGQTTGLTPTAAYFSDSNKIISILNPYHVDSSFNELILDHSGSYLGLTNISLQSLGTGTRGNFICKDQKSVANLETVSFTDFGTSQLASGVTGTSVIWRRADTVTQSGAKLVSCLFDKSFATSALKSDNPANVQGCEFISNGAATGHAIEITKTGTYQFDGNVFTNYSAISGSTSAPIYNNSNGYVILNVVNASVPAYRNGTSASTTISASTQVTITKIKDDSEVRVYSAGTTTEIAGIETVVDGTTDNRTFSFAGTPGNFVDIVVFHVDYEYYRINSYEIPGTTTSLPIEQRGDRVKYNPPGP
jgi:hypothetical protein